MYCTLIVARYPKYFGAFGFISMALFRLPLWLHNEIKFWKLMGSGKNGTFDKKPDLNQWALFTAENLNIKSPVFLCKYWKFFHCDIKEFLLEPIEGHGLWDGKKVFKDLSKKTSDDEVVAVLTRATIRLSRLKNFWKNVNSVASKMNTSEGFILSYGVGELPWIKQATFSVWQNKTVMKNFAYSMQEHADVIRKTRQEKWYKEELFVRFRILSVKGFSKSIEAKMFNLQPSYEEA